MTRPRAAIDVVAGVLRDPAGRVLLARRAAHQHQGNLWEFPGGKREPGEGRREALERELAEEIGIRVLAAHPLIEVRHAYPDRTVRLDVWSVERWSGEPHGREGQPLRWQHPREMVAEEFPAADLPIIERLLDTAS